MFLWSHFPEMGVWYTPLTAFLKRIQYEQRKNGSETAMRALGETGKEIKHKISAMSGKDDAGGMYHFFLY